jgi:SSS family solute:Na+ symporter/sodium/pantothenate symporter
VTLALYVVGSLGTAALGLDGILADTSMIGPAKGMRPYYLLGLDPCVWGLTASLAAGVVGSLVTAPPDPARVALLFDAQPPGAPAPATLELHPELRKTIEA